MKTVGIISEYNPFHLGHAGHIERTKTALGYDCAVVCIMSGNFVQRGDFAIFNKHARAETAVRCGADLVIEMPSPYVLSSAECFAAAGVFLLDKLCVCDYISFGSESGDVGMLEEVAEALISAETIALAKERMAEGLSYASAMQKAADAVLGTYSEALKSPNNLLGIEYLKAIARNRSPMRPVTIKREGGDHDGDDGFSASALRKKLLHGETTQGLIPQAASMVLMKEIAEGRGPVSIRACEQAILSRLRYSGDFSRLHGAVEGLDNRLARYAASEPTIERILERVKTKRYTMSRLRRMLMCACLGITAEDTRESPPYIRVLAMNQIGMGILRTAHIKSELPIITKPASVKKMPERAYEIFKKEAMATDFYVLAYRNENERSGGQEWRRTPIIVES